MAIDSRYYTHVEDRDALAALKAIPGVPQLVKAVAKVFTDRMWQIENMSQKIRISEKQLSKYYEMLPPICERLGIEIPELYLELDVNANAYTSGINKPFVVITSGLIETLPEQLIPAVLAHECGHIACEHVLYQTVGRLLLKGYLSSLADLGVSRELLAIVNTSLTLAFQKWSRCSELSADRAAALCRGSSDNLVEMCLRFAGFDKDIGEEANIEAFLGQAEEYKALIRESKVNKALEFILYGFESHPLHAVRAAEINDWGMTDRFKKMVEYINAGGATDVAAVATYLKEAPMPEDAKTYVGANVEDVKNAFLSLGFTNISTLKITEKGTFTKPGQVLNVRIAGKDGFSLGDWYAIDTDILIEYYEPETEEEIAAAHPGQLKMPNSTKYYLSRTYAEATAELSAAGFINVTTEKHVKAKKGLFKKEGAVARISVGGQTQFEKGEWFDEKVQIHIIYHSFANESEE